ncbi:MAG: aromatic ring-hydroxylating dioxygenase subunit alpha [Candidatus Melainabacteria bacterium]|nr:aromatic ring-hydroxylating dioxygenase subunit alpha [Candidatus Melainabacteria bacterium]
MNNQWLKGFWYVVGEASEVTAETQPVRKKILGQNLALFLDKDGKYSAVNDICPHMGAQLSLGKVKDGCLVCPYHHFAYNSKGGCESVPAIIAPKTIPATLMVDSYPVVNKYGMLWVYLGDEPEDKRPPIVDIPEFNDPEFRPLYSKYTWDCSLRPLLENLIDFTHFSYLHGNSFGNAEHPFRDNYEVERSEYEVSCRVKVKFNESIPVFPPTPELGTNPDIDSHLRFHMPTVVVNAFSVGPYKDVTLFHFTPIDENTVVFGMMGVRNFQKTETADERLKDLGNSILEEDRVVLASCTPEVLPAQSMVAVDKYLLACRKMYDRFLQNGHAIDRHIFPTARGSRVAVLPSPVRTENPVFARRWAQKEERTHGVKAGCASVCCGDDEGSEHGHDHEHTAAKSSGAGVVTAVSSAVPSVPPAPDALLVTAPDTSLTPIAAAEASSPAPARDSAASAPPLKPEATKASGVDALSSTITSTPGTKEE